MPRLIDVDEPFSTEVRGVEHDMEVRRDRLVGRAGRLTRNTVAIEGGFEPDVVLPKIALVELDVLGRDDDLDSLPPASQCVTERSNAATEERLKSGHAVGSLSIVRLITRAQARPVLGL
jgi:hypothetical protein